MILACLTTKMEVNLHVHLINNALLCFIDVILKKVAKDIDAILQFTCCS